MIEPFTLAVAHAELEDLRARLRATRWPEPATDPRQGVALDRLQARCERWADEYDWRAAERQLNAAPQFLTTIDKLPIHFLHARSPHADAFPIVLTHGWPGSFLELLPLGQRLTRWFDVVIPSLPGFAFSAQRPARTDPWSTPELWHRLMHDVLGYERYAAHGGDLGAGVTTRLAVRHPEALIGIHLLAVGSPAVTDDLDDEEHAHIAEIERWEDDDGAYEHQQMTRPVTLAYGLSDSPVGLLGWLVEKFRAWSDSHGQLATRFSDDDVLTWTSLYWLTNTISTSLRPYNDGYARGVPTPTVTVPTGLAVFPADLVTPPRTWAERSFNLVRYTRMPRGGHFAAFEEPDLLADDIRALFVTRAPAD